MTEDHKVICYIIWSDKHLPIMQPVLKVPQCFQQIINMKIKKNRNPLCLNAVSTSSFQPLLLQVSKPDLSQLSTILAPVIGST